MQQQRQNEQIELVELSVDEIDEGDAETWWVTPTVQLRVPKSAYSELVASSTRSASVDPSRNPPPPGRRALDFVSKVLVDKYADNIPVRRQVSRFKREGLEVPVSSLCRIAQCSASGRPRARTE